MAFCSGVRFVAVMLERFSWLVGGGLDVTDLVVSAAGEVISSVLPDSFSRLVLLSPSVICVEVKVSDVSGFGGIV